MAGSAGSELAVKVRFICHYKPYAVQYTM
uniref:Uncharacterized protein n=1 Tax=Anguilla anguilla TaxID=7936 RepID=A0A0E9TA41_ANGAN